MTARLDVESIDWVGTSMGGLIGMVLAAQARTPIRRLVLVDVGPVVTAASMARISKFVGKGPRFDSIDQAESYLRVVGAPFGPPPAEPAPPAVVAQQEAEGGERDESIEGDCTRVFR